MAKDAPKKRKKEKISPAFIVLFFLLVTLLCGFVWMFMKYQSLRTSISETDLLSSSVQQEIMQKELEEIIQKVERHIVLPNEQPILATIEDVDALVAENEFFLGASNGDKVLIYSSTAIIYNPEKDLLINVGPVYGDPDSVTDQDDVINIEVRNGSYVEGGESGVASQLEANSMYSVIRVDNAVRQDYVGNIIVNVNGVDVSSLEQMFNTTSSPMPEGEYETGADVVIIVGN
ncbi:LytR C-terminal domain-containing protein [Patescibacteria group bacterium]|nr:LytR C-terminal domain-containing protein [Patescibacteria group bacterium]